MEDCREERTEEGMGEGRKANEGEEGESREEGMGERRGRREASKGEREMGEERGSGAEGERRLLAPSVLVLCIPALVFSTT